MEVQIKLDRSFLESPVAVTKAGNLLNKWSTERGSTRVESNIRLAW